MGKFLDKLKANRNDRVDSYPDLIKKLSNKDAAVKSSVDDLDDNVTNSTEVVRGRIMLGCIYMFKYSALKPTTYSFGGKSVDFADDTPIVLVTKFGKNTIRGLNLNFCNRALKAIIIDIITSMDDKFYSESGAADKINKGEFPLSDKVYKFFSGDSAEDKLIAELKRKYPMIDYSMLFRTYAADKIKQVEFIEPYMYLDLPDITYTGMMKGDILSKIQQIALIKKATI